MSRLGQTVKVRGGGGEGPWWVNEDGAAITLDVVAGDYFILFGDAAVGDGDYDHDRCLLTTLGDGNQRRMLAMTTGSFTISANSERLLMLHKITSTIYGRWVPGS